jgi:hypothetical protein
METEEKLLVALIAATAGAMLLASGQYVPEASIFPRAAAVVTLFFAAVTVVQSRVGNGSGGGSDLLSQVQAEAVPGDTADDADGETLELGKSEPGEFRISQPTSPYRLPLTDRTVPKRAALAGLLTLYLGLVWLSGIFISSVVFMVLYASVMDLSRKVTLLLVGFTVVTLVLFGMWLGTPLFRPAHQLFTLPEVPL